MGENFFLTRSDFLVKLYRIAVKVSTQNDDIFGQNDDIIARHHCGRDGIILVEISRPPAQ